MAYQGITFDNQLVTAAAHGTLFKAVLTDGVISGCALTYSGFNAYIASGYMVISGREFKVSASTTFDCSGGTTDGYARIKFVLDMNGTATASEFGQVTAAVEYATTPTGFAALTQEDINGSGTTYEWAYCIVKLGASAITSVYAQPEASQVVLSGIAPSVITGQVPISKGGTGATTAAAARTNLGVAAETHTHAASDCVSGTLSTDRLPTIPVANGGTGCTTAQAALTNLLNGNDVIVTSAAYGTTLPTAGTAGRVFFLKA